MVEALRALRSHLAVYPFVKIRWLAMWLVIVVNEVFRLMKEGMVRYHLSYYSG